MFVAQPDALKRVDKPSVRFSYETCGALGSYNEAGLKRTHRFLSLRVLPASLKPMNPSSRLTGCLPGSGPSKKELKEPLNPQALNP